MHFSLLGDTWIQDRLKAASSLPLKSHHYYCILFLDTLPLLQKPTISAISGPYTPHQRGGQCLHAHRAAGASEAQRPSNQLKVTQEGRAINRKKMHWLSCQCSGCARESWNPQLIPHSSCIAINLHIFTYINTYPHNIFSTLNQTANLITLNGKRGTTVSGFLKAINGNWMVNELPCLFLMPLQRFLVSC